MQLSYCPIWGVARIGGMIFELCRRRSAQIRLTMLAANGFDLDFLCAEWAFLLIVGGAHLKRDHIAAQIEARTAVFTTTSPSPCRLDVSVGVGPPLDTPSLFFRASGDAVYSSNIRSRSASIASRNAFPWSGGILAAASLFFSSNRAITCAPNCCDPVAANARNWRQFSSTISRICSRPKVSLVI